LDRNRGSTAFFSGGGWFSSLPGRELGRFAPGGTVLLGQFVFGGRGELTRGGFGWGLGGGFQLFGSDTASWVAAVGAGLELGADFEGAVQGAELGGVALFDMVLDDAPQEEVFGAVGEVVGVLDGGAFAGVEGEARFDPRRLVEEGHVASEARKGGIAAVDPEASTFDGTRDFDEGVGQGASLQDREEDLPLAVIEPGEEAVAISF